MGKSKEVEDLKEDKKDAKKVQRIGGGITCQQKVLALGAGKWKKQQDLDLTITFSTRKTWGFLRLPPQGPKL